MAVLHRQAEPKPAGGLADRHAVGDAPGLRAAERGPNRTAGEPSRDAPDGTGAAVTAVLALLTVLRLVLAAALPLAPDEAYYWTWSRALAPGYFDHPPMVALWIRAGTWLAGDTSLGVRVLSPLAAALGSGLLWDAANRLLPGRRAGMTAVLLLNATLLIGAGGILMTPDAPLMLFWTAGLWAMARIIDDGSGWWWVATGLFVGLAAVSKYTALLLVFGLAIWLVVAGRAWLRRPAPYLGAALALVVAAPVLWWNATHGWVSFLRQGVRIDVWSPERAPQFLLELIGGQMALATPLIFLLCAVGMAFAARSAWRARDPAWSLLAVLGPLPALVFIQHATGDRVQANWPAILYPAATVAAAGLSGGFWRRLRIPAIALGFLITGVVYVQAAFAPLPVPGNFDPIARQLAGWRSFAATVDDARRQAGASFVAVDQSGVAAELARRLPGRLPVIGVGPRWWSFSLPAPALDGTTGILVESARHATPIWPEVRMIGTVTRRQNEIAVQTYRLYLVVPDHSTSAVVLPRPDNSAAPGRREADGRRAIPAGGVAR